MIDWLRPFFGGRESPQSQPTGAGRGYGTTASLTRRKIGPDDAKHIEAAIVALQKIGLRLKPELKDAVHKLADEIAAENDGISFSAEPTFGDWTLIALSHEPGVFENAAFFSDHCYDGIDEEDFSLLITEIIQLAGRDWPFDSVTVADAKSPDGPLQYMQPVTVTIHETQPVSPFSLSNAKDFDWSVIWRLNERLPPNVSSRFWVFQDGNATIVFLTPDDARQLNALCGYQFQNEQDWID
jgi:hypothetical protein